MTSKFDDIKPYDDAELPHVLNKLVKNSSFINTLVEFRFAAWPSFTKAFIGRLLQMAILFKIRRVKTLQDFQMLLQPYLAHIIETTNTSFTISGLNDLDLSKPCLFISNHRDIVLDSAYVNWALHLQGQNTVRAAVGDNLLHKEWVADLMRLNKCFVVQRSVEGRRAKLHAAKLLSEYMHHSLRHDHQHVWIAQKEGRAKDGMDCTNPAIISMLLLNKPKDKSVQQYINELRVVPVAISYEFDPCDISKAKELVLAEQNGEYNKPDNEDMRSIVNGIVGNKGQVHIHFGKVITENNKAVEDVVSKIDEEILLGYKIYPTAEVACKLLEEPNGNYSNTLNEQGHKRAQDYLLARLRNLTGAEKTKLLEMYANPLKRLRMNKRKANQ